MLRSSEPWARAAATRVLCYWRDRVANPLALLKTQVNDSASRRAARGRPRRELLPDAGGRRGRARVAEPSAGSVPRVHARPDDEHAEAVRQMTIRGRVAHTMTSCRGSRGGVAALLPVAVRADAAQQPPAPKILLDASPRAVEYQLGRLTQRRARPRRAQGRRPEVPAGVLRAADAQGPGREYFDEALAALTKLDKATTARVLLEALAKVRADDERDGGQAAARAARAAGGRAAQGTRGSSRRRSSAEPRRSCCAPRTAG